MKKAILILFICLIPSFGFSQMRAGWHSGKSKTVCAAYGYGKFTGSNGKNHKYVPYGRRKVKGRSHKAMLRHAARRWK